MHREKVAKIVSTLRNSIVSFRAKLASAQRNEVQKVHDQVQGRIRTGTGGPIARNGIRYCHTIYKVAYKDDKIFCFWPVNSLLFNIPSYKIWK